MKNQVEKKVSTDLLSEGSNEMLLLEMNKSISLHLKAVISSGPGRKKEDKKQQ